MTLNEIEYGSLASSAILNGNFQFLQDKITELSALITSETSSFSSVVATLNSNVGELLASKALIPVGGILACQSGTIPDGFLLCDGSEIRIEDYENLYDVIGATYGQNDSTTFCIPDLTDRTLWGASDEKVLGSVISAGLPNIEGHCINTFKGAVSMSTDGAFYTTGSGSGTSQGVTDRSLNLNFDASRSNPIYGNSDTVQPPAVATNYIIKY